MRKIIFASHHRLASGMRDTLNYLIPNMTHVVAIDAYLDNDPITETLQQALADLGEEDEALVFTDLLGGSVNQAFTPYLAQGNVHVITGMNLPVILTLLLSLGETPITEQQIQQAIAEAREQLLYVNAFIRTQASDEEDE